MNRILEPQSLVRDVHGLLLDAVVSFAVDTKRIYGHAIFVPLYITYTESHAVVRCGGHGSAGVGATYDIPEETGVGKT